MQSRDFKFNINDYYLPESAVEFTTDNVAIQNVFDDCEALCRKILKPLVIMMYLLKGQNIAVYGWKHNRWAAKCTQNAI